MAGSSVRRLGQANGDTGRGAAGEAGRGAAGSDSIIDQPAGAVKGVSRGGLGAAAPGPGTNFLLGPNNRDGRVLGLGWHPVSAADRPGRRAGRSRPTPPRETSPVALKTRAKAPPRVGHF